MWVKVFECSQTQLEYDYCVGCLHDFDSELELSQGTLVGRQLDQK